MLYRDNFSYRFAVIIGAFFLFRSASISESILFPTPQFVIWGLEFLDGSTVSRCHCMQVWMPRHTCKYHFKNRTHTCTASSRGFQYPIKNWSFFKFGSFPVPVIATDLNETLNVHALSPALVRACLLLIIF